MLYARSGKIKGDVGSNSGIIGSDKERVLLSGQGGVIWTGFDEEMLC